MQRVYIMGDRVVSSFANRTMLQLNQGDLLVHNSRSFVFLVGSGLWCSSYNMLRLAGKANSERCHLLLSE